MSVTAAPKTKIDLENTVVLIVDDNRMSLDILNSAFMGYGVRERVRVDNLDDALRTLKSRVVDLIILAGEMQEDAADALLAWIRREAPDPVCFTPVVVVLRHTARTSVFRMRDAGANYVVAKPISAGSLLSRVIWIARERRAFLKGESYTGPDRRFQNTGIPIGIDGRRAEDHCEELGGAVDPNLSQNEVDMMMKPMKVDL
jgi:DNA-binding response OmpR family regulator